MPEYEQFETEGMAAMNLGSEAAAEFQTLADMGGFRATKDMEAEKRKREELAFAQAERQQQMMKDARKKQKKSSQTSTLLSLIGTGVGFAFGGPGGAAAGGTIGGGLGTLFGQEGGEVPLTGKFNQSAWKNLQRREDYLSDLSSAIDRAQKPSWGRALEGGAKGLQVGLTGGDLLGKLDTVKMAKLAMEGGDTSWGEAFKASGGFHSLFGDVKSEVASLLGMAKPNVETSGSNFYMGTPNVNTMEDEIAQIDEGIEMAPDYILTPEEQIVAQTLAKDDPTDIPLEWDDPTYTPFDEGNALFETMLDDPSVGNYWDSNSHVETASPGWYPSLEELGYGGN